MKQDEKLMKAFELQTGRDLSKCKEEVKGIINHCREMQVLYEKVNNNKDIEQKEKISIIIASLACLMDGFSEEMKKISILMMIRYFSENLSEEEKKFKEQIHSFMDELK